MGGLFGGKRTQITTYSGIQVQTTSPAQAIPIVWGETMIAPVLLDYEGFHSKKKGSKGGGKGGVLSGLFGNQGEVVYYADVIMALCEGPIAEVVGVYQNSYTPLSITELGLTLENGNLGQAPSSYWSATYPTMALGYSGIAYVWQQNMDLGPSATVGSYSFVVQGPFTGTGFNGTDADPARVILDFLTNPTYGVGFPSDSIAPLLGSSGDASVQTYCQALGLCFSPALNDRETASSVLSRWLQLLNCAAVWSSGVLKFIPYGDRTVTGVSVSSGTQTYVPDLTVQFDLDDEAFVAEKGNSSSDPVNVIRTDPYEAENYLSIEITGRNDNYRTGPVSVWDQGAMDRYGPRIGSSITAHEICDLTAAQVSAQLILQRGLYIRRTFTFKLSWQYAQLDPMDIVTISDARLGLAFERVRITDIEEDDIGLLSVTAEEMPDGVATPGLYPVQAPSNGAPDQTVAPKPVNTPIIFEPGPTLADHTIQIWCAISPHDADPNTRGAVIWSSFDNVSYGEVGVVNGISAQGFLSASLASYGGANPDTTDTLSVDLRESAGELTSTTGPNAAGGATLCYVDGELIGFTTATLTSANQYNLTGLYRGLFGTSASAHSAGTDFALLTGPLVKYGLPNNSTGQTIYLKFQTFNIFGGATEDLGSCTAYSYTITGAGL